MEKQQLNPASTDSVHKSSSVRQAFAITTFCGVAAATRGYIFGTHTHTHSTFIYGQSWAWMCQLSYTLYRELERDERTNWPFQLWVAELNHPPTHQTHSIHWNTVQYSSGWSTELATRTKYTADGPALCPSISSSVQSTTAGATESPSRTEEDANRVQRIVFIVIKLPKDGGN